MGAGGLPTRQPDGAEEGDEGPAGQEDEHATQGVLPADQDGARMDREQMPSIVGQDDEGTPNDASWESDHGNGRISGALS